MYNATGVNTESDFFLFGQYLSDDQRAVFAGCGARIALALVMNNHGFDRLRLSITQPGRAAEERKRYSTQIKRYNF